MLAFIAEPKYKMYETKQIRQRQLEGREVCC